ncbi:E3 ubiquitin-protein ligase Topors-like [Scaptodrosophila lebanonensis]|uniref:RING-type E3 ubiquitin transferase n=1 Tax=Drosophila lebanonensis TaxID=7225 RepID=A0A6J2UET7_DROLE|nr:E3 ubiquitin-protein ligase Topors-like [Scaptodrosophila lebanonensis]
MGTRRCILWRLHVYNNRLYSMPGLSTHGYRDWGPRVYARHPGEVHRVMNWVNRDVSVLIHDNKTTILTIFDLILSLLPCTSMKSYEFRAALLPYFEEKTHHFIYELINFARSPYDDLITYELNVQYCYVDLDYMYNDDDDDDGDSCCTLTIDRAIQNADKKVSNFVEFSHSFDNDDCRGFELHLDLEDDDSEALDEMSAMSEKQQAELMRALNSDTTNPQPPTPAGASADGGDFELELAIERSIIESGDSNISSPRVYVIPNPSSNTATPAAVATSVNAIGAAPQTTSAPSVGFTANSPTLENESQNADGRIRRRRNAFYVANER